MDPRPSRQRVQAALERVERELLAARASGGYWEGELSSSALSTATAVIALAMAGRENSRLNTQNSRLQTPNFKFQTPTFEIQTANSKPQAGEGEAALPLSFEGEIAAGLRWLA